MTVPHPLAEAFPHGTVSDDVVRLKIADATPLVIHAAADFEEMDFQAINAVAVPWLVVLDGVDYTRYPAGDGGASVEGVTLVAESGECYKAEISDRSFVNVLDIVDEPPGDAAAGDRYIASAAPMGDFAAGANFLFVLTSHGWEGALPEIGFSTFNIAANGRYHYAPSGEWKPGDGAGSIEAGSVGAAELAFPWGMVVVSETATPPGTRVLGATPAMPLGGTAANVNDDTAATTATTGALGNLTGAAVSARIIAQLDFGADVELAAIQAKQLRASTGSSSANAMGFYYATHAAPTTWVQLGSGFTLTAALTDFARSGPFTARYIALVTEGKNWAAATHTLGDFNGYAQATTLDDGVKVLVAANGIGAFAGHDTEVAEAWDGTFRFYVPYVGAGAYNVDLRVDVKFNDDGVWSPPGGQLIQRASVFNSGTDNTSDLSGTNGAAYNPATPPTTAAACRRDDNKLLQFAARRAGDILEFEYSMSIAGAGGVANTNYVIGLFRGGDVAASAHDSFLVDADTLARRCHFNWEVVALDEDPHDYHVRISVTSNTQNAPAFSHRRLTAKEFTP